VAAFFLSPDPARRDLSFRVVERTLSEARKWGAEYVVTHLNWVDDSEDEAEAEQLAEDAARRLSSLSERYRVSLHLECGGYSGGFHRAEQFAALAGRFPGLGLCLDIGHLWLIAGARGRAFYRDLEILAPQARSLHVWNTKDLAHYGQNHHVPVHPSQRPAEGWIDIERALGIVLEKHPDCPVIFEYVWLPSDEAWVREGMAWVAAVVSGRTAPDRPAAGAVRSIHLARVAGEGMTPVAEARAVPGKGLEGDRYFNRVGTYSNKPGPDREVTLIEREVLEALERERGIRLAPNDCRRNIVTSGVRLGELAGREFRVGEVTLRGIRLCQPCAYLESLTVPGVLAALVNRGGLRAQILTEGVIRVGDPVVPGPQGV
jgi:MOSC domain-containing protein YiiM/sugar phosphate isomerase/epimerase